MKRTQITDAVRNVTRQKVSWIAVVVISMLSVLAYLGINFASIGLAGNGNEFYDKTSFRDAEIISTLLVTPEDIDALSSLEGIRDVEGVFQTTGKAEAVDARVNVDVVSLTSRINVPMLLDGRLPQSVGECALEKAVFDSLGVEIGDEVTVTSGHRENAEFLMESVFTVTGVVYHPDHASLQMSMPGNRDVIVLPEAFDKGTLGDCYMKAAVLFEGTEGLDRFSDEYREVAAPVLAAIEKLGEEREEARAEGIRAEYESALRDAKDELAQGKDKLDAARLKLDDGWKQLEDGERKLKESAKTLKDGAAKLEDAKAKLAAAKIELAEGQAKVDEYERQLNSAKAELERGEREYSASGKKLRDGRAELEKSKAKLDEGKAKLESAKEQIDSGHAELTNGYAEIRESVNGMADMLRFALSDALGEYVSLPDLDVMPDDVDPDDPDVSLSVVNVGDVTIDMSRSLPDNIFAAVSSLGVPEDALRDACAMMGEAVSLIADRDEVIREFTNRVILYYDLADLMYDSFAAATVAWDEGHEKYISGVAEYNEGVKEYEDGVKKYEDGKKEYENGEKEYAAARVTLDDGWAKYLEGRAELNRGIADLEVGKTEYAMGEADYEAGKKEYDSGVAEYEAGARTIEKSRLELEAGEAEYESGVAEYNEGVRRVADAEEEMNAVGDCHWVVLGASGNAGYISINHSVGNIADMGITFALMFILVGAIMIYATSGRIVEEQRRLVGATKALGLYAREIFAKYVTFGVSATALGMALGVAAGYFGLQRLLLYIYGRYYVFGAGRSAFAPGMTAAVFAAGILLSALAVWSACSSLLRSTATSLMQDKTPPVKKKSAGSGKNGKSLYSRLIIRNMLSDKKRLVVTIVSIAGCCALLTAGFTMRTAVLKALDAQFDNVAKYDFSVTFEPEGGAYDELSELLDKSGADWVPVYTANSTFSTEGRLMASTVISADLKELDRFYSRVDIETGEVITEDGDGVWINQRAAEIYGISAGDAVTLFDGRMDPHPAVVSGAFTMYAGKDFVLSLPVYEKLFGSAPEYNAVFAYYGGADSAALKEAASKIDGVVSITDMLETKDTYMSQASVMNLLAIVMIVIAGLMAYFILLNLTNMYIQQKKRELTIMRINGFTVREVINYVLREMIVTTVLGIVIGLGGGSFLGYRVIKLMESVSIGFIHDVQFSAWFFAAVITVVYSVTINFMVLRKVKYLKLSDVA